MDWLQKTAGQVGKGVAAGAGVALLVCLFGFSGGQGWSRRSAGLALAVALLLSLVVLLSLIFKQGYGPMFGLKSTEEETERRRSLLPFISGVVIALLAIYLAVQPPPNLQ